MDDENFKTAQTEERKEAELAPSASAQPVQDGVPMPENEASDENGAPMPENGSSAKEEVPMSEEEASGFDEKKGDLPELPEEEAPLTERQKKRKKITKILLYIACILIMAGTVAFTAYHDFSQESVSLSAISDMIGKHWYYLLVLAGLFMGLILLESLKIFLMIQKTSKKAMPLTAFNCAALGKFYDYITPLGTGGQPFQIYYLAKKGVPSGPAGAIPIGSFFLNQLAFFVLSVVCFIIGIDSAAIGIQGEIVPLYIQIFAYIGSVFMVSISLFLVVFSFMPKVGCAIIRFGVAVLTKLHLCKSPEKWRQKGYRAIYNNKRNMQILFKSKRVLIVCTLLSFLYAICMCSMPYFTLLLFRDMLPFEPSWRAWFEITDITFFIMCAVSFIPTPGNAGAADGTFYGLFKSVLTVAGTCFTGMMIWRLFSFYAFIILGVIVFIGTKVAAKVKQNQKMRMKRERI